MAKKITSGKREREKTKQSKRQEKQKKKEERKGKGGSSFEEMLAYADENGVLHSTPQSIKPKEEVNLAEIQISVPKQSEIDEILPICGQIEYFNVSKGYGFVKDASNNEKYFFHISNASAGIVEGDKVTFEIERTVRGLNAVNISVINK